MSTNKFKLGEKILYRAKVSWFAQLSHLVIGLLIITAGCSSSLITHYLSQIGISYIPHKFISTLFTIIIFTGIFYLFNSVMNALSTELIVTNKRIITKSGFINHYSTDIYCAKIESIEVKQSLLARIFNYGSIAIRGIGGNTTPIASIAQPIIFKTQVNDYLNQQQE